MRDLERFKSLLRDRLGDAYTVELGESVARVSRKFAETRYDLSQQAMQGEIDGETLAIRLNEAASDAIAELRPILGEHFDDVVGLDESFMLVDPAIAREIDYTQVPKDALVTPNAISEVLEDPICVDILHHLSNQSLDVAALARELDRSPKDLEDLIRLLQEAQLVCGQSKKSVTIRVRRIAAVHGGSVSLLISDDSGVERLCWLSPSTGMDPALIRTLVRGLTGRWSYSCVADDESPAFNDEEAGRGGIMNILAYANSLGGIDAAIRAERRWYIRRDGTEVLVDPPRPWRSKGGVSVSWRDISFNYTIDNESGRAKDSYVITQDELRELNGTFEHIGTDQVHVFGVVKLEKQDVPEDAVSLGRAPSD